jgi:hypothetical protein
MSTVFLMQRNHGSGSVTDTIVGAQDGSGSNVFKQDILPNCTKYLFSLFWAQHGLAMASLLYETFLSVRVSGCNLLFLFVVLGLVAARAFPQ